MSWYERIYPTSFESLGFAFAASLTFPETPFGKTNRPFSEPVAMALEIFVNVCLFISRPYDSSMNLPMVS